MTDPYIRASELNHFAFCRRAWFLERQGVETTLTDVRESGTLDHARHATAVRRGQTLDRASRGLFRLVWIALALLVLAWLVHR
jgi:hypothetical protein